MENIIKDFFKIELITLITFIFVFLFRKTFDKNKELPIRKIFTYYQIALLICFALSYVLKPAMDYIDSF